MLVPVVKFPKFTPIWIVATIAAIVMTANELQVRQLGEAVVMQLGQAVYEPYIIFPYRLAIVVLGVLVAYFWTIFPYPVSEHSELREDLAKSICTLANYNTCTQQVIVGRLFGRFGEGEDQNKSSIRLHHTLRRLFRQNQGLLATARLSYQFLDWEFSLGGRFPQKTYGKILSILERLGSYMMVTSYVSQTLGPSPWWMSDETGTVQSHLTPREITTRMIMLYSALGQAHSLPPGLGELRMPDLSDFLGRRVPTEEGFAAAALLHSVNWFMIRDLNSLT